jgi:WD repeat-containing protein 81
VRPCALQDNTIKLWDLRYDATHAGAAQVGTPGLLHTFSGHTEGVGGLAVHDQDVLAYSGPHLGVFSLQAPWSAVYRPIRLTSAKGFKESASIVGLALLPYSRLLVVGTDDGHIKICH